MKRNKRVRKYGFCLLFLSMTICAQTPEWKNETTKDGKIKVRHRISNRIGINGKEAQLVEYVATTTSKTNMKKLTALVKNVPRHKEYLNISQSIVVDTISAHESIVYYFYKGVWPYPNSDIVAKMVFREDVSKKTATFILTSAPTLFEDKGVRRLDYYNLTYSFKEIDTQAIEMTISARFTPAVQLPAFLMGSWFPDGPAAYLINLIKLANEGG